MLDLRGGAPKPCPLVTFHSAKRPLCMLQTIYLRAILVLALTYLPCAFRPRDTNSRPSCK